MFAQSCLKQNEVNIYFTKLHLNHCIFVYMKCILCVKSIWHDVITFQDLYFNFVINDENVCNNFLIYLENTTLNIV